MAHRPKGQAKTDKKPPQQEMGQQSLQNYHQMASKKVNKQNRDVLNYNYGQMLQLDSQNSNANFSQSTVKAATGDDDDVDSSIADFGNIDLESIVDELNQSRQGRP